MDTTKPWETEPDFLEFEANGFACHIKRHPQTGHLCGYMRVPEDHPWFQRHYDSIEADVHGGLTFSNALTDGYYIGFDCGHCDDYIPRMPMEGMRHQTYRDINYVREELVNLTLQAVKAPPETRKTTT